jgi:uncharacterized membrane protein
MNNYGFARGLFAVAAASLAILALSYGDFAPGGASLPAWLPYRAGCTYAAAFLLLAASAGLLVPRTARISALIIGLYHVVWVALGVPSILSEPLSIGGWYGSVEALTGLVGAWILYGVAGAQVQSSASSVRAAQIAFGLCCVFYGASHFVYADYTAGMVPAWLPARVGWAYLTGLGHVAAGLGVISGVLPRLAANLEAIMMSLFGLLVWLPTFIVHPAPKWAGSPHNQWSEVVVNVVLAAAAWVVAASLRNRTWGRKAPATRR